MRNRYYYIMWLAVMLWPCLEAVAQGIDKGKGGGLYLEDHARALGVVVYGNRAEDGFGIYGEAADVVNCTVAANELAGQMLTGVRPGYIYCADGRIVDREVYRTNAAGMEPVGVVFWVNSDVYASRKGYVVALTQEVKAWGNGPSQTEDFACALYDTAAYENTRLWAVVSEAAQYCTDYSIGTFSGKWALPAGYQLMGLFSAISEVEKSLDVLEGQGVSVSHLVNDVYWSCTETADVGKMWVLDFGREGNVSGDVIGAFFPQEATDQAVVRPVFGY